MKNKTYEVTGRYMTGTVVCSYNITDLDGNNKKVTREQLIFLLGQGKITNCTGQIYNEQVLIRGLRGLSIAELPIIDVSSGKIRNNEVTNVTPSKNNVDTLFNQITLTHRIMRGKTNLGFQVRTHGGKIQRISREQVIYLASKKLVTNAVVQNLVVKGDKKQILRGVGIDLRLGLPVINL